jgi:hypothetical protein
MTSDPRWPRDQEIGVIANPRAGAETQDDLTVHVNEEFDRTLLAGPRIHEVPPRAGDIDKQLLAGPMHLAHRRLQRGRPATIPLAKLAVAVAARMRRTILQPDREGVTPGFFSSW